MPIIIAIDGPAGSGKGTIARKVAATLGLPYLDTGSLYRGVGICVIAKGASLEDATACEKIARGLALQIPQPGRLVIDGQDVSEAIRGMAASDAASRVSVHPGVRSALLGLQRQVGDVSGCVVEGRDTTTVVFPDATLKIYLTADVRERARRVGLQEGRLVQVEELQARDKRDSTRPVAPLKPANDAALIDSTELNAEEVVERVLHYLRQRVPQVM